MNSEFENYRDEFIKQSKRLLAKFHTAPNATPDDQREASEEFQMLKNAFEGMQLTTRESVQQYKTEFNNLKNAYHQYCPSSITQMGLKQNQDLQEYLKQGYEAEGIAMHTQFELKNQTNKLNRILNTNKATQNDIEHSEGLVLKMQSRACFMKTLTYGLIGLILIAIGVIIYIKFD